MKAPPVPVLVNPTAGRGRAGRNCGAISNLLQAYGIDHRILQSVRRADIEDKVYSMAHAGADRIVVAGGDGSVHEAVNGLLRAGGDAALGLIPIGTGNDFAKACGMALDWETSAQSLANRMRSGLPASAVDVGQMNERYFANSAGIGFDAKVSRIAESIDLPIGNFVYLVAVFRAMWDGVTTSDLRIEYDGGSYSGKITLACIANGDWAGGMFRIAPMAKNDDGTLDLVFAKPVSRLRIAGLLPKLMRGSHIGEPEIVHAGVKQCAITATAPVPSHLDGEIQPMASDFKVKIIERGLQLL